MFVIVDEADVAKVGSVNWHAQVEPNGRIIYAVRSQKTNGKSKKVYLHRLIMAAKPGQYVDHKDGNGLNCQRSNLRLCDQYQNGANSRLSRNNTSGYKGVSWEKVYRRWAAYIYSHRKKIVIGYFDNAIDAARAYNDKAVELFGEFAKLNMV